MVLLANFLPSPCGRASGGTAATFDCLAPPAPPRELDSPPADTSFVVSVRLLVLGFTFTWAPVELAPVPLAELCAGFSFAPPEVSLLPVAAALGVPFPPPFEEELFAAALHTAADFATLFGVDGFVAEGFCGWGAPELCLLMVCMGVVGFGGVACTASFGFSALALLLLFAELIVCRFPSSLPPRPPPAPKLPSVTPTVRPLCKLVCFPAEGAARDLPAPALRGVGVEGWDVALAGGRRPGRELSESSEDELVPLLVSPRSSLFSATRDWSIGNLRGGEVGWMRHNGKTVYVGGMGKLLTRARMTNLDNGGIGYTGSSHGASLG